MLISTLCLFFLIFLQIQEITIANNKIRSFRPCFEAILNLTQSCSNVNHLYATTMGVGSGFASEFNYYLIKSVLTAIFTNRRYSYLITNRPWEYNCAEGKGWGCYFTSPCTDGYVETKDMDFLHQRSPFEPWKFTGPGYVDNLELRGMSFNPGYYLEQLQSLKEVYQKELPAGICDNFHPEDIHPHDLAGPIARHIFHGNEKTKKAVYNINRRYEHIQANHSYASLLLRMGDKVFEMPQDEFALLSDINFVTDKFLSALKNHTEHSKNGHVRDIFIGK